MTEPDNDTPAEPRDEPAEAGAEPRRSGLRNPAGAVRGMGATVLVLEAVVLLLAIAPLRMLGGPRAGSGMVAVVALAVLGVLLVGLLRRTWAWHAATFLQVMIIAAGVFHLMIGIMGVVFLAVWLYILHVRHTILRP